MFEKVGEWIENVGNNIKSLGDDISYKKVHEGNESKEECYKLYNDIDAFSKKLNYRDSSLNFIKPKCTLYVGEWKKTVKK